MAEILAWHVWGKGSYLKAPPKAGDIYTDERAIMCKTGLHASEKPLDCLGYINGSRFSRVICSGGIKKEPNKLVCKRREHLWVIDAERVLHEFALEVATEVLQKEREAGREPDKRAWNALDVKRLWLQGKASDKELATATVAATWAIKAVPASRIAYKAANKAPDTAAFLAAHCWANGWPDRWAKIGDRFSKMLHEAAGKEVQKCRNAGLISGG